jgi:hypothetical protein
MFDTNLNWKKLLIDKGGFVLLVAVGAILGLVIYNAYQNRKFSNIINFSKKDVPAPTPDTKVTATAAGTGSGYHGNLNKRNGNAWRPNSSHAFAHPRV